MAAQLVAFDSGYCAVSAGGTGPLVFLPTSARDPARNGLTGWPRAHAQRPGVYAFAARAWKANRRNRAPMDAEDGVPVSAATDESGATSLVSLAPTAPRKAWHLANSASQLVTPDASWGVIWARHMTPNVVTTTRIAVRLLQRTRDECVATIANPLIRDGACSVHRTEDGGGGLKAMTTRAAYG